MINTIIFAFSLVLFIAPGLSLSLPLGVKGRPRLYPDAVFIGCAVGIPLSCLIAALVGLFLGFHPLLISMFLLSISLLIILCRFILTRRHEILASKTDSKDTEPHDEIWKRQDYIALLAFLVLTFLLTAIPFSNVGKETDHGIAFTYLMDNDFLQHSAIAAEIAKGVPPQNIYFSGEPFQYHWLSHVFPAFVYLASQRDMETRNILIWALRCYAVLFVCMLFSMTRSFFENRKAQILVVFLAICAYSYNAIYVAFKPLVEHLAGISGLFWLGNFAYFSNVSNGYFRDFLVEPHTLLALSATLAMISMLHRSSYLPNSRLTSILLGILLGTMLGLEGFVGMTMILWFCILYLYVSLKHSEHSRRLSILEKLSHKWQGFVISMSVASIIILSLFLLKIFTVRTGVLIFKPYVMIIALAPIYLLLSYGPSFVLTLGGVRLYLKKHIKSDLMPILLLGLISVALMFFVRHFAEPNHVLRKSGKILQIPLLIFSGVYINHYLGRMRNPRAFYLILSGMLVLGMLTLGVDIYSFSNIYNASNTTYVSMNDYRATRWIRDNTPLAAVVQSKPNYQSALTPGVPSFEYSLISMFAERRMAVGDSLHAFIYQIGKERQLQRQRDVNDMFTTSDADKAMSIAEKYNIDYIYAGDTERKTYGSGISKFDNAGNLFGKVYSKDGISIYKLNTRNTAEVSDPSTLSHLALKRTRESDD